MNLDEIQGNVICGYGPNRARFIFARIDDREAARAWLARRLSDVTWNISWQQDPPRYTLNLGFTYTGLRALGVPKDRFAPERLLPAFTQGMRARAASLGDTEASAPDHWDCGLRDTHLVVILSTSGEDDLPARQAELELCGPNGEVDASDGVDVGCPPIGITLTHVQTAATLTDDPKGPREHFGFSDGFSQPAIAGANTGPRRGEGVKTLIGRWRDVAIGEFVLGSAGEGGMPAPGPMGPLASGASFMVVRKLEQDVAAYRAFVSEWATRLGQPSDWVGSRLIGRWPNGSPVAKYPDAPGPHSHDARERTNDFSYGDDKRGLACPLGAHVRRANPRDALGWETRLAKRHRMLRRGIGYGPPFRDDQPGGDGQERGLMFVSFQGSLERQFEFVQRQWLGDGNVFGLGSDCDPLFAAGAVEPAAAGGASRQMVIQGDPPRYLRGIPDFVRTRGGDYYLYPGRSGLAALVNGTC